MQRKALVRQSFLAALATVFAALALGACGGGEDTGTTAPTAGGASGDPGEVQQRADQIKEERRGKGADESDQQQPEPAAPSGSGEDGGSPEPPSPSSHQDSGGGAAQFSGGKGGDNSIQEFGQEASGSEMARAAAVLHAYLGARADRRWDDACSYLSAEAVAGIEQFAAAFAESEDVEGCPDVLGALTGKAGDKALREGAQADVGSLRAQGGRGFLLYHGAQGVDYAIAVVEEGGDWKLAAPEATPLP
jgi:hypothetical protein